MEYINAKVLEGGRERQYAYYSIAHIAQKKGESMKGFFWGIVATIAVLILIGFAIIKFGLIPANADATPGAFENWAADASLTATLQREAPKGPDPVPLNDKNLIAGIHLYAKHCAICHGTAAGDPSASPIARGEYPAPPQLATDGVEDDPEGWDVWKVEHGIRWTGMPSWKGVITKKQAWTLALFLKHMDKLPPAPEQVWKQVTN